jgi:DNA helicase HerA-like ATPase
MHPIPKGALDDRLAFVGTAGSGKTYNAGSCVERLLAVKARCVVIDPLGVWWGLRLKADGRSESAYDIPIFGGAHGDLVLTEHAGALIGETVAGMAESCILDSSQIGTKAGERRFMLVFVTALYRGVNGSPVHLIIDEADMWAPQRLLDKEGEAAKLLGMMETIVRRGRVRGFIPWLITQRPAVLSKDVLSQADGIVSFKLTASQDRDAIGAWIEGQADKPEGKAIPAIRRARGISTTSRDR